MLLNPLKDSVLINKTKIKTFNLTVCPPLPPCMTYQDSLQCPQLHIITPRIFIIIKDTICLYYTKNVLHEQMKQTLIQFSIYIISNIAA